MLCAGLPVSQALPRRTLPQLAARSAQSHRKLSTVRTMAVQLGYEAWVKGDPNNKSLGDCKFARLFTTPELAAKKPCRSNTSVLAGPFCHRALLTLEEKQAKYTRDYVDFADKPKWSAMSHLSVLLTECASVK